MYVCMYVCMYVYMHVCIYLFIRTSRKYNKNEFLISFSCTFAFGEYAPFRLVRSFFFFFSFFVFFVFFVFFFFTSVRRYCILSFKRMQAHIDTHKLRTFLSRPLDLFLSFSLLPNLTLFSLLFLYTIFSTLSRTPIFL